MAELNKLHLARWMAAQKLVVRLLTTAVLDGGTIMFENTPIEMTNLVINERGIYVDLENCRYIMFEADPEYDHGLYDKVEDFEACFRNRFTIVKKLEY